MLVCCLLPPRGPSAYAQAVDNHVDAAPTEAHWIWEV
jgi:hypothetical protein